MTLYLDHRKRKTIGKFMAYLLRHDQGKYQMKMGPDGFVDSAELLEILRSRWRWLDIGHIHEIIEGSEKKRFEIQGGRIRARYGHSIDVEPDLAVIRPPDILYHGTTTGSLETILEEGLRPMNRRYVHLSESPGDAIAVGRRRQQDPVVLEIEAGKAHEDGIEFRKSDTIYLVRVIPPEYIKMEKV